MHYSKTLKIITTIIFIYSCGGGGGGSSVAPIAPPTNTPSDLTCSDYQTNTQKCSFTHNSILREYYLYTPSSNTPSSNAPLMFVLHGYGSSATNIMYYSEFQSLAEQDGFILVYPQGSLLNGVSHWNVGGWTVGSTVDDVDFIEDLIDIVATDLYIDSQRIYSTGMSNGGYMSYGLACNSDKFAAIASVTGSMTPEIDNACNPSHPTSVLQIHGLEDNTVLYDGASWSLSIPEVMLYWQAFNSCDENPLSVVADFEDGSYILYDSYQNCSNSVGVELILHSAMGHNWPRLNSYGVSATEEIWAFFAQYNIDGKIN
tara:strand:- start:982 stop:1926 length:945 start_codon:yes stop_codon:yes gene_type:complete